MVVLCVLQQYYECVLDEIRMLHALMFGCPSQIEHFKSSRTLTGQNLGMIWDMRFQCFCKILYTLGLI